MVFALLLGIQLVPAYSDQVTVHCGYPGSPAHGDVTFSDDTLAVGTIASYHCDPGYELLGPSRRRCTANATWVPQGIPFCVLNVAAGKAPLQSSTMGGGIPQKAVDGSTSPYFNPDTCSLTEAESSPWWYVNLLEPYVVQLVRIDFGQSCCGKQGQATIVVRVGNNRPDLGVNPICNKYTGFIEEGRPLFLPCTTAMSGAFVSVHFLSNPEHPLSLCEFFVYTDQALPIERCPSFRDQPLGSVATYNGKCYIFYNNQQLTFDDANNTCEERGGSLVDETSPALQGFLSWELYRRHRNDPRGQYWMGATRDPDDLNNWRWLNGDNITVSFWNSPGGDENCAKFDGARGWLWSDTDCDRKLNFICQHRPKICGRPERPPNSTILATSFEVGSVIEYKCDLGNLLIGPNIRTCLPTGFFSEYSPRCKYIDCGRPAPTANGQLELLKGTTHYLSTVQYSCNVGFVLVGRAQLVCDVDGRWNGPPARCEPIVCQDPPHLNNGRFQLSSLSQIYGTTADYICDPGYELEEGTVSRLRCGAEGYWEGGVHPRCLRRIVTFAPTEPPTEPSTEESTTEPTTVKMHPNFEPSNGIFHSTATFNRFTPQFSPGYPHGLTDYPMSTTLTPTSTTTTTKEPTPIYQRPIQTARPRPRPPSLLPSHRKPSLARVPQNNDPRENEILSAEDSRTVHVSSAPPAAARLNMGGFIALGVFGGFVVLSAIITIIVLVVRRNPKTPRKTTVARNLDYLYGGHGHPGEVFGPPPFPPAHLTRISPVYCPDETDTVSTAADDSAVLHKSYKRAWDNLKVDIQDEGQRRDDSSTDQSGFRRPKGAWTYAPVTRPNDC
ncbi:uncharacterized protein LOC111264227 isoform X4 [Varroa jacobsoni]|nr:uncharacterized protein LOC111264227 isoform X4 [Varroa jacobsoni]XP_022695666.1 uncharacterized protein LOC111264227 isoform X4 [Varroa jacobsoni]